MIDNDRRNGCNYCSFAVNYIIACNWPVEVAKSAHETCVTKQQGSHIQKERWPTKAPYTMCVCLCNIVIWNCLHCKRAIRKIEYNYLLFSICTYSEMFESEQTSSERAGGGSERKRMCVCVCMVRWKSDDHVLHVKILNKLHELFVVLVVVQLCSLYFQWPLLEMGWVDGAWLNFNIPINF